MPPEAVGLRKSAEVRARGAIAARSDFAFAFFGMVFERTLRGGFHALRIAKAGPPPAANTPRLVIYSNHASWWDGVAFVTLARRMFPKRRVFAPIDSAMLERYALLGRIGAFGVDQTTARGAADFLAVCRAVFADPDGVMMITAQGRFADVRERPLRLAPGISHIATLLPDATFVPMALEYTYWIEKQPEMLLRFGTPLAAETLRGLAPAERLARLETALADAMDALATDSIARNEAGFSVVLKGQSGVNPLYDGWRAFKAALRGRAFNPEHGAPPP